MLQYALLHLFGYDLTIDDLKGFRVRLPPNTRNLDRGLERSITDPTVYRKLAARLPDIPKPTTLQESKLPLGH